MTAALKVIEVAAKLHQELLPRFTAELAAADTPPAGGSVVATTAEAKHPPAQAMHSGPDSAVALPVATGRRSRAERRQLSAQQQVALLDEAVDSAVAAIQQLIYTHRLA